MKTETMKQSTSVVDPLKELDEAGEFPEVWMPEPGDQIRGVIRRYTQTELEKSGLSWICTIQEDEETVRSVFLTATVLKSEFARKKPQVGEKIVIRFLGVPKGKQYKKFLVSLPDRPDAPQVPNWADLDPDEASYNESVPAGREATPYAAKTMSRGGTAVAERPRIETGPEDDLGEDPFADA